MSASEWKRGGRYTETKALEKSLVQDGDAGEQSQPRVRTVNETSARRDAAPRHQRRGKIQTQGNDFCCIYNLMTYIHV